MPGCEYLAVRGGSGVVPTFVGIYLRDSLQVLHRAERHLWLSFSRRSSRRRKDARPTPKNASSIDGFLPLCPIFLGKVGAKHLYRSAGPFEDCALDTSQCPRFIAIELLFRSTWQFYHDRERRRPARIYGIHA